MRRLFGCPDIVSLTDKFLMARSFFRIFTENNPVMGYSKTFFIPEAKGLRVIPANNVVWLYTNILRSAGHIHSKLFDTLAFILTLPHVQSPSYRFHTDVLRSPSCRGIPHQSGYRLLCCNTHSYVRNFHPTSLSRIYPSSGSCRSESRRRRQDTRTWENTRGHTALDHRGVGNTHPSTLPNRYRSHWLDCMAPHSRTGIPAGSCCRSNYCYKARNSRLLANQDCRCIGLWCGGTSHGSSRKCIGTYCRRIPLGRAGYSAGLSNQLCSCSVLGKGIKLRKLWIACDILAFPNVRLLSCLIPVMFDSLIANQTLLWWTITVWKAPFYFGH